ncbi:MAG: hypothetical protein WBH50_08220 [Fuerstiella sp.]
MLIQQAEELKREWTDKHVMVQEGIPELRRFSGLLGQVKTVNMNCRLLIEFDTPADISWYDIDPLFAKVVDPEEFKKPTADTTAHSKAATSSSSKPKPASTSKPATTPPKPTTGQPNPLDLIRKQSGGSPLDAIRTQAAANATGNAATTPAAAAAVNPLDLIRKQASEAPSGKPTPTKPAAATTASSNPLDLIRAQNSSAATPTKAAKPTAEPPAAPQPLLNPPPTTKTSNRQADVQPIKQTERDAAINADTTLPETKPKKQTSPFGSAVAISSSTAIDQIRAQAAADSQASTEAPNTGQAAIATIFDQVKVQADRDEVAGNEDPVKLTFKGSKLPQHDDLKIVEGIGPKIEELLHADGIKTWQQLSLANIDHLKEVMSNAGPRFRMHNPETWPQQAKLAAEGLWQQLEKLQEVLDGGRPPE